MIPLSRLPAGRRAAFAPVVVAFALAGEPGAAAPPSPGPPAIRPVTASERFAVESLAAAAARGSEAIWERLAGDAPLRSLGHDGALAELDARLGTLAGARAALDALNGPGSGGRVLFAVRYASGLDDLLLFSIVPAGEGWAIASVASGAERFGAHASESAGGGVGRGPLPRPERMPEAFVPAAILALLAAAPPFGVRSRRRAAVAASLLALVVASCGRGAPADEAGGAPSRELVGERLGALAPLRRAATGEGERGAAERALASAPGGEALAAVRRLWEAQLRYSAGDARRATELLAAEPLPSDRPLAELLRARLAFARFDLAGADAAIDRLAAAGFDSDALRLEAVTARLVEGEAGLADPWIGRLAARGCREADLWYLASVAALHDGQRDEAERLFAAGWRLAPRSRGELLSDPAFGFLATRETVFHLVGFDAPEGSRADAPPSREPIALPPGAVGTRVGALLRLDVAGLELTVPSGASIAPSDTVAESAEQRNERDGRRALAGLPRLFALAATTGATPSARELESATDAARALADAQRWPDLLRLTEGAFADPALAGGELARLRVRALGRSHRPAEARDLLVALAGAERGQGRSRVATLYQLGAVLSDLGELDQAIRALRAADAQMPVPFAEGEIRRLGISRDLRTQADTVTSPHFSVQVPRGTDPEIVSRMLDLLERERERLRAWIPRAGSGRIAVELLPVRSFFEAYGDLGISGLYDGRVRVPFVDAASLDPELVAIASHEVAHAMLDAATGGQAPHWFSEGLAQHVETFTRHVNPMPALDGAGRRISFTALEPILEGFAEEQLVELAYSESAWAVGYLEAKHGQRILHRLTESFAAGLGTDEAVAEVLGFPIEELDRRFWNWGVNEAPPFRFVEGQRYDEDLPPGLTLN